MQCKFQGTRQIKNPKEEPIKNRRDEGQDKLVRNMINNKSGITNCEMLLK